MKITVGIPAFNEEKNISDIIQKLSKICDTVIVCNDGSTDDKIGRASCRERV
mgnify:CR=1 FL=1